MTSLTLPLDKCNPRRNPTDEDSVVVLDVGGGHQTAQDTDGMQLWRQEDTEHSFLTHNIYVHLSICFGGATLCIALSTRGITI